MLGLSLDRKRREARQVFSPLFRRSKPLVFASDLDFNLYPKRFPECVNHLLTRFSQGYKINGYSGPCANTDALVIVPWATQRGLFAPLPSQTCRYTPLESFPRNTPPDYVPYSPLVSQIPPDQLPYFRVSAQNASCPN